MRTEVLYKKTPNHYVSGGTFLTTEVFPGFFGACSIPALKLLVGGLGSQFPGLFACNLYTLGQDFYASDVNSTQAAVAKSSVIKVHGDGSLLLVKKWQEAAQETMISLAQDIGYRKEIRGMNLPIHDSCSTVLLKAG